MCVDGLSLIIIGLDKTVGHRVYGVWLAGSCQNTIYQAEDSGTRRKSFLKERWP